MRPTRPSLLVTLMVVAGGLAYLVTRSSYDSLPRLSRVVPFGILLLALAEGYLALSTHSRIARRPGTRPAEPLVVARYVALAKASSLVAALATGGYAGFLLWVARLDSPAAGHDTATAALGAAASVLLAGAALFLEHVCKVPKRDDDDDPAPSPG
jgi:hypothetical protein